eukprot:Nk52_evm132s226 gene=Nk52_evmTU132s226
MIGNHVVTVAVGAAAGAACLFGYYLHFAVKKPSIVCNFTKYNVGLLSKMPSLKDYYWPTFWCFGSHLQTITSALKKGGNVLYRREYLTLTDGGKVGIDWYDSHPRNGVAYQFVEDCPTVVMLHGLTGGSDESYIVDMVRSVGEIGYRSVVFNYRGCHNTTLHTPKGYCGASTGDVEEVLQYVRSEIPDSPLVVLGVSMGSILLMNYLSEVGKGDRESIDTIRAGMVVSVPWNSFQCMEALESGFAKVYNYHLAGNLTRYLRRHSLLQQKQDELPFDMDHGLQSSTIREFDTRVTAPMFGFDSLEHYYTHISPHSKVYDVKIPLLCLNAVDDPFCPVTSIPFDDIKENPNIILALTARGGHVAFLEGTFYTQSFVDRVVSEYVAYVFTSAESI